MAANRLVSPHATRVTFTGTDLADLVISAPDQRVKLFIPASGTTAPAIAPGAATARDALARIPEAERPHPRTYTIRAFRGDRGEMDVDFALREPGGPASNWARSARPGQSLEMLGPIASLNRGFLFRPPPGREDFLLVGDQSALPAIGAIVESLPQSARGHVFVTVPSPADQQHLATPDNLAVTWLPEGDRAGLIARVRAAEFPEGRPYAWLAGEAGMVGEHRQHLLRERGLTPGEIASMAYWRTEHTEATAHRAGTERRIQLGTSASTAGLRPVPTRRSRTGVARLETPHHAGPHIVPDLHVRTGFRPGRAGAERASEKALML